MKSKFFNLLILIFVSPFILCGDEALTLDQCIEIALRSNPLILSQHQQYLASQARITQARALPQPELGYDSDLQPRLFDFKNAGESYLGISQLIEFPGRVGLRGKIAKQESQVHRQEWESIKQEIIYRVKGAFFRLLSAVEFDKYAAENERLALDYFGKAEEKYRSGDVAKIEVLRAKVEASRARNAKKVTTNGVNLARARLNFLLARDRKHPLHIEGQLEKIFPELEMERLIDRAVRFRPEIEKMRCLLERERLTKKQVSQSYFPDFSLGIARHYQATEPDTWNVNLSFEIPLYFWQKRGFFKEADAAINAISEELKYIELNISLEVEKAYHTAVSLRDQILFFQKDVLAEADEVYGMSMISYREGKIGGLDLIEARRTLIDLKMSYIENLLLYRMAVAELEKYIGTAIEGGR